VSEDDDQSYLVAIRGALARPDDFVRRLAAIPKDDSKRIWGLCMSELKYLKTTPLKMDLRDGDIQHGYKLTALRSALTGYRNAIRSSLGKDHIALRYLRPSAEDQESYKELYNEQLVDDHSNLRPIDAEHLVDTAEALIKDYERTRPFALAAAIALVTGRRSYEVACTGSFAETKGEAKASSRFRIQKTLAEGKLKTLGRRSIEHLRIARPQTLVFSGQLKTRGAADAQLPPYEIPTLIDPNLIRAAHDAMHRRYPFAEITDNKQFNGHVRKEINTAARVFEDATLNHKPLTSKDLRSAYATIAYSWYGPETVSMNVFFARILGHADLDVQTSLSYVDFYPLGEKTLFARRRNSGNKEDVAVLQRLLDRERDPLQQQYLQGRIAVLRAAK